MATYSLWRPYAIAFALGAIVIGGFDFLYTQAGGQYYFAQWIVPPFEKWPIYIPIQMGLAGVVLLFLWTRLLPKLRAQLGAEPVTQGVPVPLAALLLSLLGCFVFLGHRWHGSAFALLWILSMTVLLRRGSRLDQAAFVVIGISGGAAEWLLLSPEVEYWRFHHQELFGRLPAWEPLVYGWIGVIVHRLASAAQEAVP